MLHPEFCFELIILSFSFVPGVLLLFFNWFILNISSVWFSHSVVFDCLWPPWIAAPQASLASTYSWSLMPYNHLILCHPLILLPSVFPSIRIFSNESMLHIRWQKYWNFSFSISPSNECSGLISFRMDWIDVLAVQGTLNSLLQYHSSKSSILHCSAFFMVQLSHPCMTTGKKTNKHSFDYMDLCWQSNASAF